MSSSSRIRGSVKQAGSTIVLKDGASDAATLQHGGQSGTQTVQLPATSGTHRVATLAGGETLTNKTIVVAANTITTAATGNLAATELNAALAELQGSIDSSDTALTAHAAATATHGVSGAIVGTSDAQTLTNKVIDAAANTVSNLADANIKAGAAIDAAKIGAGSVSNTEFGYLDGVTSAIQTQIDAKQAADADLTALAGVSSAGVLVRTGAGTAAAREVVSTSAGIIEITDGDGVADDIGIGINVNNIDLANLGGQLGSSQLASALTGKALVECGVVGYLDVNEEDEPATPLTGAIRIYAKDDGKLYWKDDAGTEYAVADTGSAATTDNITPVGTIVAYLPGYFTDVDNVGFTVEGPSGNSAAAVNAYLSVNWRVCDGSLLNDVGSPIFNGDLRYLPNISDSRFLMGSTAAGSVGGANTMEHTHSVPAHYHGMGTGADLNITASGAHTHASSDTTVSWSHSAGTTGTPRFYRGSNTTDSTSAGTISVVSSGAHTHASGNFSGRIGLVTGGVDGNSAMTSGGASNTENRPAYLSTFYIMRVK